MTDVLKSQWGGLSEQLIASFTAVDYDGKPVPGEPEVRAPIMDGAMLSLTAGWTSPFEHQSFSERAPTLAALVQSGALVSLADRGADAGRKLSDGGTFPLRTVGELFQSASQAAADSFRQSRGLTSLTKLNSTQVFVGAPPVKIDLQVLFRAWNDPFTEVEQPVNTLLQWAVPQQLADAGLILGTSQGNRGFANGFGLLPSLSPMLIRFSYAGAVYPTMVIESISEPLTSPRTRGGQMAECVVGMQLATLAAMDRNDVRKTFQLIG